MWPREECRDRVEPQLMAQRAVLRAIRVEWGGWCVWVSSSIFARVYLSARLLMAPDGESLVLSSAMWKWVAAAARELLLAVRSLSDDDSSDGVVRALVTSCLPPPRRRTACSGEKSGFAGLCGVGCVGWSPPPCSLTRRPLSVIGEATLEAPS